MQKTLLGFIAGFLATLIFHQGVLWLLHTSGMVPFAPFNMTPVPPLGVPQVISLAFWGGLWGILLVWLLGQLNSTGFWLGMIILGAIAPTAVALLVVFPLKGMPLSWNPPMIMGGLLLNGAWGLGTGLFYQLFGGRKQIPSASA